MGRVLLVEDNEAFRTLATKILERNGHTAVRVESGEDALAVLEGDRPDLVLLDLRLPGIDGQETAQRIMQRDPSVPIVVYSATTGTNDRELALQNGAVEFLPKPFRAKDLAAVVDRHVGPAASDTEGQAHAASQPPAPAAPEFAGTVLIVDDNEDTRRLYTRYLEAAGFACVTAGSASEAIDTLRSVAVEAVVLDLVMGEKDKDGFFVLEKMAENPATSKLPVLILSGQRDSSIKVKAFDEGASDYLTKPVDRAEFCARMRVLIDRSRRERSRSFLQQIDEMTEHWTTWDPKDQYAFIDQLDATSVQLSSVVDTLIDYSLLRTGALILEEVDVADALAEAKAIVEAKHPGFRSEEIGVSLDPGVRVKADRRRFIQVLVALLDNAVQATGGAPAIRVSCTSDGGLIARLEIADEGVGMSEETMARMYDEFFHGPMRDPSAEPGLGLGLSLVKKIVTYHDATMSVTSSPGFGTNVTIIWPM